MPANISNVNGRDQAWYADKPAWHGLGLVTEGARTAAQVIDAIPVFQESVKLAPVAMLVDGEWIQQDDFRATYRNADDGAIGVVGTDYATFQDSDGLYTMETIIAAAEAKTGIVPTFVTGGALGSRAQRSFASLDLTAVLGVTIDGDPSRQETHLFGTWAHDGSGALNIGLYINRIECQNMLNAGLAHAGKRGLLVSIRHTGRMGDRVAEARQVLGFAEREARTYARRMEELAATPIPDPIKSWLDGFGERLIPIPDGAQRTASRLEARELIKGLTLNSRRMVGVAPTAYRVLQAVVEYADHYRPLRPGKATPEEVAVRRFGSILDGPAAQLKDRAMELLHEEFLARN